MRLIIGLLFALLTAPAFADDCPLFGIGQLEGMKVQESSNARVHETVKRVRSLVGITEPYLVCEWTGKRYPGVYSFVNAGFLQKPSPAVHVILLSPVIVERSSIRALEGIIAHEFAHLKGGYEAFARLQLIASRKAYVQNEINTDKIAAGWVGPATVREGIFEVLDRLLEYADSMNAENSNDMIQPSDLIEFVRQHRIERGDPLTLLEQEETPW